MISLICSLNRSPKKRLQFSFGLVAVIVGTFVRPVRADTQHLEYEGALYHLYRIAAEKHSSLDLRWLDDTGAPLANFGGLQKQLTREGRKILFATNAGIYESGPKPCGLTICCSKQLVPLNTADGFGNFFLKPNGVFYLDDQAGPGIVSTNEYSALNLKPRLANQSGPLLLRKGVIHPAFKVDSPNKRQRSAIAIVAQTQEIIFLMSDRDDRARGRVTFHQLSRALLHLGCQDALYLDGDISQMITSPAPNTKFSPNTFAAMFVVTD